MALTNKSSSSAFAWGSNKLGQLGVGERIPSSPTPTPISTETDSTCFISVSCGPASSIAVDINGSIWTWGWDAKSGLLGSGFVRTVCSDSELPTCVCLDFQTWVSNMWYHHINFRCPESWVWVHHWKYIGWRPKQLQAVANFLHLSKGRWAFKGSPTPLQTTLLSSQPGSGHDTFYTNSIAPLACVHPVPLDTTDQSLLNPDFNPLIGFTVSQRADVEGITDGMAARDVDLHGAETNVLEARQRPLISSSAHMLCNAQVLHSKGGLARRSSSASEHIEKSARLVQSGKTVNVIQHAVAIQQLHKHIKLLQYQVDSAYALLHRNTFMIEHLRTELSGFAAEMKTVAVADRSGTRLEHAIHSRSDMLVSRQTYHTATAWTIGELHEAILRKKSHIVVHETSIRAISKLKCMISRLLESHTSKLKHLMVRRPNAKIYEILGLTQLALQNLKCSCSTKYKRRRMCASHGYNELLASSNVELEIVSKSLQTLFIIQLSRSSMFRELAERMLKLISLNSGAKKRRNLYISGSLKQCGAVLESRVHAVLARASVESPGGS